MHFIWPNVTSYSKNAYNTISCSFGFLFKCMTLQVAQTFDKDRYDPKPIELRVIFFDIRVIECKYNVVFWNDSVILNRHLFSIEYFAYRYVILLKVFGSSKHYDVNILIKISSHYENCFLNYSVKLKI